LLPSCQIFIKNHKLQSLLLCTVSILLLDSLPIRYSRNIIIIIIETNEGGKVTIFWNQPIQIDRTIPNNKPDITIRDNEKGICVLIDVAISGERNVIKKEAEKIPKYKDLTIEIERMWNVKTKMIPVIIGATGTISKSFRKNVSNIPGKQEVKGTTENSHIGHCTHTAESSNVKVQ
jgi:hypothetical protein